MPLSKKRNRERMRKVRLHARVNGVIVQPKVIGRGIIRGSVERPALIIEELGDSRLHTSRNVGYVQPKPLFDADGYPIYEE